MMSGLFVITVWLCGAAPAALIGGQAPSSEWLQSWLVTSPDGRYGRTAIHVDPLQHALVMSTFDRPTAGATAPGSAAGQRVWTAARALEDGWVDGPHVGGGYAWTTIHVDAPMTMLLDTSGHRGVYINGIPRGENTYGNSWLIVPVRLQAGENSFLFHCRGRVRARLVPLAAEAMLDARDLTLPDILIGQDRAWLGGVPVINGGQAFAEDLVIEAVVGDARPQRTTVPRIAPCAGRKVPFTWRAPHLAGPGPHELTVRLLRHRDGSDEVLHEIKPTVHAKLAGGLHKRTFRSAIDDSVQYYCVLPATAEPGDSGHALFFSLHGAGANAVGQASSYKAKDWGLVVAGQNRRSFGFDWEDWGRLDFEEVFALVMAEEPIDPRRVHLTGHSMGGHGTWSVGVTFPDRFATVAPSSGWISFWSYGSASAIDDARTPAGLLRRAVNPSDTLALVRNLQGIGAYILHSDQDESVPVSEARRMREVLAEFHTDFAYYEKKGAAHWWGGCLDWPPMFDFFRRHQRPQPQDVRQVDFRTANPGLSSSFEWASVDMQRHPLAISHVQLTLDTAKAEVHGSTDNVARLSLDIAALNRNLQHAIKLDDDTVPTDRTLQAVALDEDRVALPRTTGDRVVLRRTDQAWQIAESVPSHWKGPQRYGPFKRVFRRHFALVYGTTGEPEENHMCFVKARLDAETFQYRANGNVELVPDHDFDPVAFAGRNVILYGHADCNSAFSRLLSDSPIQVRRGRVIVGQRELQGADLGVLLVRPHPDHDLAMVGVVGGSGVPGLRATHKLPYFVSGIAYPDYTVLRAEALLRGADAVVVAGFFGEDWGIDSGDVAWNADEARPANATTEPHP